MSRDPIPMDDDGGALAHQCALEYEQWLEQWLDARRDDENE
ncbi:MAG TPA: hypothetical protein VN760_10875 [Casimicrobiaceae bacterium]|nr:hypothetical protein [Casimicrobiaceae bacterium]